MTSRSPADIVPDGSNIIDLASLLSLGARAAAYSFQRQEQAVAVAQRLFRGEYDLHPVRIGGAMGLDRSSLGECALLCVRPLVDGPAMGFWTRHGGYAVVHLSCYRTAVRTGEPPVPGGDAA